MTSVGDIVVVHVSDKPSVYARIEAVEPDVKAGWFRVKLLLLTFPPREVIWILRREYIEGARFTMQDVPMHLSRLQAPSGRQPLDEAGTRSRPKVIPLRKAARSREGDDEPTEGSDHTILNAPPTEPGRS
ncbi:MAG TPA: hypothetical protein PLS81_02345 [Deltaproteobacteria bacterium]|nr:hypothetical protein [Deltaproteobacteria bacterium]HPP81117.1 hypothetical protein [Deltaproteobacteria bacterium]